MAGVLSGTSRVSLGFMLANGRALVTISAIPFALIMIVGTIYLMAIEPELLTTDAEQSVGNFVRDLALNMITALMWAWLMVKVLRFYLLDEAPSAIGAGGTIRCTGTMFIYNLGLIGIAVGLGIAVVMLATFVLVAIESTGIYGIVVTLGVLGLLWIAMRLFVGFVPVAVGERPAFFSGWALTETDHFQLFFRALAAVVLVVLVLFGLTIAWTQLAAGSLEAIMATGQEGAAAEDQISIGDMVVYYGLLQIVSLVANWFFIIFFAEAYLRLTNRPGPLQTV